MKKLNLFLIFCCLLNSYAISIFGKVRVLTFQYNRPEFIRYQYATFSRFLIDDYELIVFNDAPSEALCLEIEKECNKYGIQCVRYEQEWHYTDPLNDILWEMGVQKDGRRGYTIEVMAQRPSVRHNHVIQFALDNFGYNHDDIIIVIDGDMFPIKEFSIREMIKGWDIIGSEAKHPLQPYLWVTFVAFIPNQLPNLFDFRLHHGKINGRIFEGAANTVSYLKENPSVKIKLYPYHNILKLSEKSVDDLKKYNLSPEEIHFIHNKKIVGMQFHLDENFIHWRGGSNPNEDRHLIKKNLLDEYLEMAMWSQSNDLKTNPLRNILMNN